MTADQLLQKARTKYPNEKAKHSQERGCVWTILNLLRKEFSMGLDMYLNGTRYLLYKEDSLKAQLATLLPDAPGQVKRVVVEAAYWRKANAIHAWFVRNVQEGKDDCGDYDVSLKTLTVLRDTCRQVLADPTTAPELLPSQGGFFFGSTEYDKNYLDDLKQTDTMLTKLIDGAELYKKWTYEYHSSW